MRTGKQTRLRLRITADRAAYLHVATIVAAGTRVPLDELIQVYRPGHGRRRRLRLARVLALYLANTAAGISVCRLGRASGIGARRVSSLCHKGEDLRDDPDFDALCERLTTLIVGKEAA